VDKNLALSEAIAEWFDLVGYAECEVMIGKRHPDLRALTKELEEICNIEPRTNIEVWLVKAKEKFKDFTTGPVCYVEILRHGDIVRDSAISLTPLQRGAVDMVMPPKICLILLAPT